MALLTATLDKLIWVLLYAGLFAIGLGVWMMDHHVVMGWSAFVLGAGACVGGGVLFLIRARRP
jgi:hypothetical protein